LAVTELGPKAHQPYFPKFQGGAEHPSARRAAEPAGTAQARQRSGAPRAPGMPCRTTGGCLRPRRSAALAAGARLRVVAELVVEALPGALVGVCDGDVAGVRQPLQPLAHERDAALEQRQHRVAKVEALLRAAPHVRRPRGCPPCGRAGGSAPQQPHAHAAGLSAACMSATRSCSAPIRPARSQCSVSMSAMCERTVVGLHACNGPPRARASARVGSGAPRACSAWMSKMTTLVGPPRESGMLDRMRASVTAVATSPSASTCAAARRLGRSARAARSSPRHIFWPKRKAPMRSRVSEPPAAPSGASLTQPLASASRSQAAQAARSVAAAPVRRPQAAAAGQPQGCHPRGPGRARARSAVPVGKYGSTSVKEPTNMRGSW